MVEMPKNVKITQITVKHKQDIHIHSTSIYPKTKNNSHKI